MGLDGVVMSWTAVIPVKRLDTAKSRLGPNDDPRRPELALAFALDVIDACLSSASVSAVIVVTDDDEVIARASQATICPEPASGGLNGAIRAGAALVHGPVMALAGDLPAVTPAALDYVTRLAAEHERSLLSDTQGSGTAILLARDAGALDPRFGVGSRAAHVASGGCDLALDSAGPIRALLAGARRDVDTPADLWDALRLGVGAHTTALLARQS
ncbi:MAG: 2-phospho-L-lactate guanylyltransferase [Actinomycetota bacterium]|jgi:2-phospho-L-lactate guanylyltransferase